MIGLPTLRRHKPLPPRDQWAALRRDAFERSGGRCQCAGDCGAHAGPCGAGITLATMHCDHIIPRNPADPRIASGPDTPTNLRATCRRCNRAKSNRVTTLPEGPLRRALVTLAIAARLRNPAVGIAAAPLAPLSVPHLTTYRLALPPGKAHVTPATVAEVRAALANPAARVYAHGAELRVEVPRRMAAPVPLSAMPVNGLRIGVGVTSAGKAAVVDLAASPHVLVSGATGSGKSVMLRTLVRGLALAGARLALVDSDADTWAPFAGCAALEWAIAEDIDAAGATVAAVRQVMDARVPGGDYAPLALVIDEAQMLDAAALEAARDIAKRGRKRRVHLVLATQYVRADILDRTLTGQCGWRIAGRLQDHTASKLAVGASGAELLGGAGDMLVAHGGRVTRVQAALGMAADFAALAQAGRKADPAPQLEKPEDARYRKAPIDTRVAFLLDRHAETGQLPTANPLIREFGGATLRNRRARDAAKAILAAGAVG